MNDVTVKRCRSIARAGYRLAVGGILLFAVVWLSVQSLPTSLGEVTAWPIFFLLYAGLWTAAIGAGTGLAAVAAQRFLRSH